IDVVNDLFSHPFSVLPILLARMKQKDEEWRFSQREWSKVWHTQTEHMHLKSLDHMGILAKQADKRQLSAKHLVDVIKTKHEEQRRERSLKGTAPRHQFQWSFSDKDVALDLLRLMCLYAIHNSQHSNSEKERIWDFFVDFIPAFFDLDEDKVQERIPKFQLDSGDEDADEPTPLELTNGRSRRNGKRGDLLRGVLDPGRGTNNNKSRASKEDRSPGSKETTPDATSGNDEETPDASNDPAPSDGSTERWMPTIPKPIVIKSQEDGDLPPADKELKADGYFQRPWYNFFANQTIYTFFSIFHVLYERLREVKESEKSMTESILRVHRPRPATDIGLSEPPNLYFEATDTPETYWPKTMELIEEYIVGDVDEARFQEVMRHFYLQAGWKLYMITDLIRTLCRLALTCSSVDGRDKTHDLIKQFLVSRERDETSYQTELSARKFAEKCIRDGELFVINWVSGSRARPGEMQQHANCDCRCRQSRRLVSAGFRARRRPFTRTT
ncbi:hypothetical protein IMZ48_42435, partial [Candidatus Bathyarchaeota archaeon]|nr:hypothetical protein [Candidatus Bathyarchaeota archaeon]